MVPPRSLCRCDVKPPAMRYGCHLTFLGFNVTVAVCLWVEPVNVTCIRHCRRFNMDFTVPALLSGLGVTPNLRTFACVMHHSLQTFSVGADCLSWLLLIADVSGLALLNSPTDVACYRCCDDCAFLGRCTVTGCHMAYAWLPLCTVIVCRSRSDRNGLVYPCLVLFHRCSDSDSGQRLLPFLIVCIQRWCRERISATFTVLALTFASPVRRLYLYALCGDHPHRCRAAHHIIF